MSEIKEERYKNQEWLEDQYIRLDKSALEISKDLKCTDCTIRNWLKRFNIEKKRDYICKECGKEYTPHEKSKTYQKYCSKQCNRKAFASTKHGNRSLKNVKLKARYNITLLKYEELLKEQNHKCKICGKELKLFVDHNHDSGKIRGLLCNNCNAGIGWFNEDVNILKLAVIYLEDNHEGNV